MSELNNRAMAKLRALAAPSQQPKASLPTSEPHQLALADLAATDPEDVVMALAPILALVGAAGMNQDDRREWLAAAVGALQHIPRDLLSGAATRARMNCDHPSKVIPFIVRDTETALTFRRQRVEMFEQKQREHFALPAPGKSACTAEEAAEIVNRYTPWARSSITAAAPVYRGPPKMPTRADYIALGVDPSAFEQPA